jgi:NAD(P)-dependent dehydrogenase (short-subunit alcohol dehydrogenase family)
VRILVVGATGVIGGAVADALAARGHEVLRASRRSEHAVDIADASSIRALYARVGRVDGVICCAGEAVDRALLDTTDEDFATSFREKLMGQVNLVRLGVQHVNDGGVFVVTAGIYGTEPPPGAVAGAMVDGALESFARAAARDLPRRIRIVAVSPPWIKESAAPIGMDAPLTAAENAWSYVEAVEGNTTGVIVRPG